MGKTITSPGHQLAHANANTLVYRFKKKKKKGPPRPQVYILEMIYINTNSASLLFHATEQKQCQLVVSHC